MRLKLTNPSFHCPVLFPAYTHISINFPQRHTPPAIINCLKTITVCAYFPYPDRSSGLIKWFCKYWFYYYSTTLELVKPTSCGDNPSSSVSYANILALNKQIALLALPKSVWVNMDGYIFLRIYQTKRRIIISSLRSCHWIQSSPPHWQPINSANSYPNSE